MVEEITEKITLLLDALSKLEFFLFELNYCSTCRRTQQTYTSNRGLDLVSSSIFEDTRTEFG